VFVGHAAVGFASKRWAPDVNLGVLLAAAFLADLIWPVFVLAGLEHVRVDPGNTAVTPLDFVRYPYTHSLVAAAIWAVAFALPFPRGRVVVGAGVLSHWVLDAISHRPDMPLWPGGPRVGLGLWESVPATVLVEVVMLAAGLWLCRCGSKAVWGMVAVMMAAYAGNLFGPPPPSENAVALGALLLWLFPLWGWLADRRRVAPRA
jgi:hypothetical protein